MTEEPQQGSAATGATDLPAAEQLEEDLRAEAEAESGDEQELHDEPEALDSPDEEALESPYEESAENRADRAALNLERDRFRMSASEHVVATCTEIFALAKTALDEVNQSAGQYLTFQQKKRIHAQAANFGAESPIALSPVTGSSTRVVVQRPGEGGVSTEDIERMIVARVQDSISSELALLAGRADSAAIDAGRGAGVSEKLDGLVGALRALERSLPKRISEAVDSKLEGGSPPRVENGGMLAAVQEVRSASTGFSIADLDLHTIAALSDRAGDTHLPRIGPTLAAEETLPYRGHLDLGLPAVEAVADPAPLKAVVFLEEPMALTPQPEPEAESSLELIKEAAATDDALESAGAAPDESFDNEALDEALLESIDLDLADLDDGRRDTAAEEAGADSENVVLAPVVTDEDSVELDLGGITGDVIPPGPAAAPDEVAVAKEPVVPEELAAADELTVTEDAPDFEELSVPDEAEEPEEPEEPEEATVLVTPDEAPAAATTPAEPTSSVSEPEYGTEVEIRLQHAAELRGRNKLAESMQQYDEVIELTGPNYEAHIGRGVVFLQTRNYDRAAAEFTKAEELDGSRPAGSLGLAEVCFHQKQFSEAVEHYSACIRLDPRLAQAFRNRGLCHYHQAAFDLSAHDLRRAFELDPSLPNIKKYLKIAQNKLRSADDTSDAEPS